MSKQMPKFLATAVLAILPVASQALPIDWHGSFGVDTTLISDFRRIKSKEINSTGDGTQEVGLDSGKKASASWQSYVFRLNPTMVINDAATFFGELSTGYANGGYLGDAPGVDSGASSTTTGNNGAPLYYYNQSLGQSFVLKKAYLELYSDTATYMIGRHSSEWALGALYNDGSDAWDRHAYSRDGITMKLKIGNFHVSPFWSKVSNPGYTDATNSKEYGASLLYDNQERDIAFGIMYSKKSSSSDNQMSKTSMNGTSVSLGSNDITVTDLYLKKVFGKFDMAIEIPLMSGELGKTTNTTAQTTYSAKALLLQTNFKWTDSWTVGFDAGQVSGHDGSTGKFGALYLNPNYQVANLLFKYNIAALGASNRSLSVYDSYMTNARYFKLRSNYNSEKWSFDSAIIFAKALEVATAGRSAYNHSSHKIFTATTTQSDSLGTEIDFNAKYHWNKEISIGSSLGYLITGDYFSYTNDASKVNQAKSSLLLQVNTAVTF
ncbi:MAG: hypothetical protein KBD76_01930 [Bacteriovorax sp.]|nr:hypothetical protein [Bacteriovorax sp.]